MLYRPVESQQLVDRIGIETWIVAPPGQLVAITEERERAIADQIDGRLVASDVKQHDERKELLGGQAITFLFGHQERRQHVVAEVVAALLDDLDEVRNELG